MNWTIGDVKITSIYEQALHALQLIMPQATAAELANIDWLKPHYVDANGEMTGIIQAFIVDTGNTRIVVDTCVGDDRERALVEEWHRAQRRTIDKFAAAGYPPDAIDVVLCTHLHTDHVGWNTWYDGAKFVPTFGNARYLFARAEFDFWHKEIENCLPEADPHDEVSMLRAGFAAMMETTFADSVQPVLDAGLVDLVETDHRICEQVRFIPTPGHTPGHVSVVIESGGERALITGDAFHHPCQIARPEFSTLIDSLPDAGVTTRRELLDRVADDGTLVIGSHFSAPSGGTISRYGESFRLNAG